MKIKIKIKEHTIENNLHKINSMILCNKIKLSDICRSQRITHNSFYIMAFRISRDSYNCDEYIDNLNVLLSDIFLCDNINERIKLMNLLESYVNFSPFNGDNKFEYYKKYLYKKIL